MKNTRKKMLLSSVAMLLVALVALGSATYAWFTINKTVEAKTMTVKAATAKGLQITGDNGGTWARTATFNSAAYELNPASLVFTKDTSGTISLDKLGTPYAPADVEREGAYEAAVAGTSTASATKWAATTGGIPAVADTSGTMAAGHNSYFATYEVGIKSTEGAITDNITMTVDYTDGNTNTVSGTEYKASDFIRVAVIDDGAITTSGTGAVASASSQADYTTESVVASYGKGASSTDAVATIASQLPATTIEQKESKTYTISGGVAENTEHYYTIVVWFEGQDSDCVNAAQAVDGTVSVSFAY